MRNGGLRLVAAAAAAAILPRSMAAGTPEAGMAVDIPGLRAVSEQLSELVPSTVVELQRAPRKHLDLGGGVPGEFNLYIFAMSWKAEWCYHKNFPGCKAPREFWEKNLTIHGLWPDYGDGSYPTTCTSEPYDHDRVVKAIGIEALETYWPNIQVPEDAGKRYDSFWEHEWTKHGTCTGLSQEDYFATAMYLVRHSFATPPQLADNVGGSTTRTELEDAYGGDGMAVLDCKGKVHLSQVYLCMVPDSETGLPKQQVACPPAIVAHDDTCGQDELDIASFDE